MRTRYKKNDTECRCSVPTSDLPILRSIPDVQYNTAFMFSTSRSTFPQGKNGKEKERESPRSSRRRAATRLERSHQRAMPLFFPPRAAAFSGSRVDPRACNAPALFHRAPALITRHRGYYRGNAKRPSFPAVSFFPPPLSLPLSSFVRYSESAPNRNARVALLSRLYSFCT